MKKFCMIIMLAVCLGSCGEGNPPHGNDNMSILDELRAHKAAWEGLGIDHYQYAVMSAEIDSLSPKPTSTYIIFPDKNPEWIISQVEEDWYDLHYPGMDWKNDPIPTISKIFDNLEQNIVNAREDEIIRVKYNEKYHYPGEFGKFWKDSGDGVGPHYYYNIIEFEDWRRQEAEAEKMAILEELRAHKAAWEGLGIDHYRYTSGSSIGDRPENPPISTYIIFPDKDPERIITQVEEDWYDLHYP